MSDSEKKFVSRLDHVVDCFGNKCPEVAPSVYSAKTPVVKGVYKVIEGSIRSGPITFREYEKIMEGGHNWVDFKYDSFFTAQELIDAYVRCLMMPDSKYGFDYVYVVHEEYLKEGKMSSWASYTPNSTDRQRYAIGMRFVRMPKSLPENYVWLHEMREQSIKFQKQLLVSGSM